MTSRITMRVGARLTACLLAVGALAVATAASPALADTGPQASASAQVDNINIPGVYSYVASSPPTSVTNDGTGSTAPVNGAPGTLPTSVFNQSGTLQFERVQAGTDGSSYACASVGGTGISVTSGGQGCDTTGNFSFATIFLNQMPAIGNALANTACPNFRLRWLGLVAHAYGDLTGPPSGGVNFHTFQIQTCAVGNCPALQAMTLDTSPNADLLAEIVSAMSAFSDCAPIADALNSVAGQVQLRTNEQTSLPDGTFQVTGLHYTETGTAVVR
jgi:hypothetical protein